MLKFLPTYYLELNEIPPTENPVSNDDDDNDVWMLYTRVASLYSRGIIDDVIPSVPY